MGRRIVRCVNVSPIQTGHVTRRHVDKEGKLRDRTEAEWVLAARAELEDLLGRAVADPKSGVGQVVRGTALVVWNEAMSNAHKHAKAPELGYCVALNDGGKRLTMIARYATEKFDTNPPEPEDIYAVGGRGILLMRQLCTETHWRFSPGDRVCPGRLELKLVMTW